MPSSPKKSYASRWKLGPDARNRFVAEIKTYLDHTLDGLKPFKPGAEIGRARLRKCGTATNYAAFGGFAYYCSMIQHFKHSMCVSHPTAEWHLNYVSMQVTLKPKKSGQGVDYAFDDWETYTTGVTAYGSPRGLNRQLQVCMDRAQKTGMPQYVMSMLTLVYYDECQNFITPHATIMLFDLVNKHQIFFDPSGDRRTVAPLLKKALIPGFAPVPVRECAFRRPAESLQAHMECEEYRGVCGVACSLLWTLCVRFEYYHLKNMAEMLLEAFPDRRAMVELTGKFVTLFRMPRAADILSRVFPPTRVCLCYVPETRDLCPKPSCAVASSQQKRRDAHKFDIRTYCAKHRAIHVLNRTEAMSNPSCDAPLSKRDWSWRKKSDYRED